MKQQIYLYGSSPLAKKIIKKNIYSGIINEKKIIDKEISPYYVPINKIKNKNSKILITTSERQDRAVFEFLSKKHKFTNIYNKNNKKFKKKLSKLQISEYIARISKLKKLIKKYDVISFDLFETLVDKKTSNPKDIYDFLEKKNKIKNFSNHRYQADNYFLKTKDFKHNINDIYQLIQKKLKFKKRKIPELINLEIEQELNFLFKRNEIYEILECAKKNKKTLILTTDTYYNKQTIIKILKKFKLNIFNKILISSELKKSKFKGDVFEHIKKNFKSKKIIHIGDNYQNDFLKPNNYKIDSFYLPNLNRLILDSNLSPIFAFNSGYYAKILIGLIKFKISEIIFKSKNNKYLFNNLRSYGYLFFGPFNLYFILFLIKKVRDKKISKLLLCAREGYFIKKKLDYIKKLNFKLVDYNYFLTSRKISINAAIYNFKDIINSFVRHRFEGRLKYLLKTRFNLNQKIEKKKNIFLNNKKNLKIISKYLLPYKHKILEKCKLTRLNYLKYLKKIIPKRNAKTAFIDQGFMGTAQTKIEKILNRNFYGIYYCNYKKKNNIFSCYQYKNSNFYNNQIFFECIYTAPHGSLIDFGQKNNPILSSKSINENNFQNKNEIFEGDLDLTRDFLNMVNIKKEILMISNDRDFKKICDLMFGLTNINSINCSKKILNAFYHENFFVKEDIKKLKFDYKKELIF